MQALLIGLALGGIFLGLIAVAFALDEGRNLHHHD